MKTLELRPTSLSLLLAGLVAYLLTMSLLTFYRYASSATDENLFTTPPSWYLTLRPIPSVPTGKQPVQDSIPTGAYLYDASIIERIPPLPADSVVSVRTFFPARIPVSRYYRAKVAHLRDSAIVRRQPPHVVVIDVAPGGASDRAGMLVGDRIVLINGKTFVNAREADVLMRQGESGRVTDYEILRGDRRLLLHVRLAAFGFPLPVLVMSLSGLVIFGCGAFILLKRPQIIAARLVGLELLALGFFVSLLMVRQETGFSPFVVLQTLTLAAAFSLLFPIGRHASTYFPRELPAMRAPWWSIKLPYIAACIVVALVLLIRLTPLPEGAMLALLIFMAVILAGGATAFAAVKTRSLKTPEYRRMLRPIIYAQIVAMAGTGILSFVVSAFGRADLVGFLGILLLLIPLAYFYIIGRYRLLDLDVRLRRNIQWGVVSTIWALTSLALLGVILFVLISMDIGVPDVQMTGLAVEVRNLGSAAPASGGASRWGLVLLGIVAFIGVRALRITGQSFIDRRFYREPTDYTRAVRALSEVVAKRLSMVELGRGMVEKLAEVLHLKRAAVFFFREDGTCCCHEAYGVEPDRWEQACSLADARFVEAVGRLTGQSRVDYLPASLKQQFHADGFQFVIPIRSKERLIGTLFLGEKQSEAPYSSGELEFFSAAARQTSVAIENAFLYEELAHKQRMALELQIARRIQLASLPQNTPSLPSFEISGRSQPAMEVGGDFFDYLPAGEDRITIIVGDVSGKGTSAALYMSKVQGILRSLHEFNLTPAEMFVRTNRLLAADMARNSFVTAIGAAFDGPHRTLLLARAGHLPLYIFRSSTGSVERLAPRGLGLALDENRVFTEQLEQVQVPYSPGDTFLLVSDGVTEAHNNTGEEYSELRISDLLRREGCRSAGEIRDSLFEDVTRFTGMKDHEDDCTVVVVKARG